MHEDSRCGDCDDFDEDFADDDSDADELDPEGPDGADLEDDGEPDVIACPECGRELAADAEVCSGCGRWIMAEDRAGRRGPLFMLAAAGVLGLLLVFFVVRC